jgi:hypothetical protein
VLILSTPNASGWGARVFGNAWIHWHAPYHLQFFTTRSLVCLAKEAGFDVERKATVTNAAWLGFQWYHILSRPQEGSASPFWSAGPRSLPLRIGMKFVQLVDLLGINVLITRLSDSFGVGDNVVYVLRKGSS